jgi:hypothetical protein
MWWPGHQLLNPSVNSVNARSAESGTVTAYRIGAKTSVLAAWVLMAPPACGC